MIKGRREGERNRRGREGKKKMGGERQPPPSSRRLAGPRREQRMPGERGSEGSGWREKSVNNE